MKYFVQHFTEPNLNNFTLTSKYFTSMKIKTHLKCLNPIKMSLIYITSVIEDIDSNPRFPTVFKEDRWCG